MALKAAVALVSLPPAGNLPGMVVSLLREAGTCALDIIKLDLQVLSFGARSDVQTAGCLGF